MKYTMFDELIICALEQGYTWGNTKCVELKTYLKLRKIYNE